MWKSICIENALIEADTRRFSTDVFVNNVFAVLFENERVGDGLGDRLNAKVDLRVALGPLLAVNRAAGNAPLFGIDASKLRDVGGVVSTLICK